MAKTNPIGLRWDVDDLGLLKMELKMESTQQILSFLVAFWKNNRQGSEKKSPPSDAEVKAEAAAKNRKREEKKAPATGNKNDPPPGTTGIDLAIWKAQQKENQKS